MRKSAMGDRFILSSNTYLTDNFPTVGDRDTA